MKASTLFRWFAWNDRKFGMSLQDKDPETQGQEICEHYGFDYVELRDVYEIHGQETGDAFLLAKLNKYAEDHE